MYIPDIIKKLRFAIADNIEPYIYSDGELEVILEHSACAYSRYRPIKKRSVIEVIPGVSCYTLPDGYQNWTRGLEGYSVIENIVDLGFKPAKRFKIEYTYLSDRKPDEVPGAHITLLIDYGFYLIADAVVKETSDISDLKLGKGLQIQFDNIGELRLAAEKRLLSFNERLAGCVGGWV